MVLLGSPWYNNDSNDSFMNCCTVPESLHTSSCVLFILKKRHLKLSGKKWHVDETSLLCVCVCMCVFLSLSVSSSSEFRPSLVLLGFPGGSEVKASACNVGDLGSIPGLGRSPGEGNGTPPQYSCLENPMGGEPGGLQSMGRKESDMT